MLGVYRISNTFNIPKDKIGVYCIKSSDGITAWFKDGVVHRDGNLPAVIYPDGTKEWYEDGSLKRHKGLPEIERSDGTKEWYYSNNKISSVMIGGIRYFRFIQDMKYAFRTGSLRMRDLYKLKDVDSPYFTVKTIIYGPQYGTSEFWNVKICDLKQTRNYLKVLSILSA